MRLLDSGLDPHLYPSLWELVERRAMEAGDAALAHRVRRDILAADAGTPDMILNEARFDIDKGETARARILLERTFGEDPDSTEARLLLGIALAREDRDAALRLLADVRAGSETELVWAVDALRNIGELRRAMALCEAAIRRFPGVTTFLNRLGWIAEGVGDLERAIAVAQQALGGDTEAKAQALNRLVRLHRRQGDRDGMIARAADLMRLDASSLQKLRLASILGQPDLTRRIVADLPALHATGALPSGEAEKIVMFLLDEGLMGLALYLLGRRFPMAPAAKRVLEQRGYGGAFGRPLPARVEEAAMLRSPEALFPLAPARIGAALPAGWVPALRDTDPILLVNATLAAGGAERQFLMAARSLVAAGVAPDRLHAALFSMEEDRGHAHFEAALRDTGIHVHDLSGSETSLAAMSEQDAQSVVLFPARLRSDVWALHDLVQTVKPAVLHGWQDRSSVAAGLVGQMRGTPRTVLSVRNMRPRKRGEDADWVARSVYREVLSTPSVTITANAREGARDYEDWLGLAEGAIATVSNAVDETFFAGPRRAPCDGPLRLLGVFRLAENKRPILWLETVAALRDAHGLEIAPRIVGAGPLAEDVRRQAARLGLDTLRLDPPVPDPAAIYGESDALLLMSQVEGTPNVVLEAQAAGLPVAACRVGGVADALYRGGAGDGRGAGLLLRPEVEAAEAASAIARWLPDAVAADPASRIGFVRDRYSMDALARTLLGLYGARP